MRPILGPPRGPLCRWQSGRLAGRPRHPGAVAERRRRRDDGDDGAVLGSHGAGAAALAAGATSGDGRQALEVPRLATAQAWQSRTRYGKDVCHGRSGKKVEGVSLYSAFVFSFGGVEPIQFKPPSHQECLTRGRDLREAGFELMAMRVATYHCEISVSEWVAFLAELRHWSAEELEHFRQNLGEEAEGVERCLGDLMQLFFPV